MADTQNTRRRRLNRNSAPAPRDSAPGASNDQVMDMDQRMDVDQGMNVNLLTAQPNIELTKLADTPANIAPTEVSFRPTAGVPGPNENLRAPDGLPSFYEVLLATAPGVPPASNNSPRRDGFSTFANQRPDEQRTLNQPPTPLINFPPYVPRTPASGSMPSLPPSLAYHSNGSMYGRTPVIMDPATMRPLPPNPYYLTPPHQLFSTQNRNGLLNGTYGSNQGHVNPITSSSPPRRHRGDPHLQNPGLQENDFAHLREIHEQNMRTIEYYEGIIRERMNRFINNGEFEPRHSADARPKPKQKKGLHLGSGPPEPKEDHQMVVNLECKACMCQVVDTLLMPCGHAILCRWCADKLFRHAAGAPKCPVCRKRIQECVSFILFLAIYTEARLNRLFLGFG